MNGRGSECGRLERAKLAEAPMRDRNDHPRGTDSATVERVMMTLHLPLHKVLRAFPTSPAAAERRPGGLANTFRSTSKRRT